MYLVFIHHLSIVQSTSFYRSIHNIIHQSSPLRTLTQTLTGQRKVLDWEQNERNRTPLHVATAALQLLLRRDANIKAARENRVEILKVMLHCTKSWSKLRINMAGRPYIQRQRRAQWLLSKSSLTKTQICDTDSVAWSDRSAEAHAEEGQQSHRALKQWRLLHATYSRDYWR